MARRRRERTPLCGPGECASSIALVAGCPFRTFRQSEVQGRWLMLRRDFTGGARRYICNASAVQRCLTTRRIGSLRCNMSCCCRMSSMRWTGTARVSAFTWAMSSDICQGTCCGLVSHLSLDSRRMVLTVSTARGHLIFVPRNAEGHVLWSCTNGEQLKPSQLPPSCRSGDGQR